jgi:acyl-CoA synthetase (AMP-forming)/AMP-acid ligase II/acyl carrier protein
MNGKPVATKRLRTPAAPGTFADFIIGGIDANAGGTLTEFDHTGAAHAVSYGELRRRAQVLGSELRIAQPTRAPVVVCCESVHDFVAAVWACIFEGRSVLPIQVHGVSSSTAEIAARLRRAAELLDNATLLTNPALKKRFVGRRRMPFGAFADLDAAKTRARAGPARQAAVPAGAGEPGVAFLMFWTSGTTAEPRIAKISLEAQLARAIALGSGAAASRSVQLFPFDTVSGSRVLYPRRPDAYYMRPDCFARTPLYLLTVIEQYKIEGVSVSSSMAARILQTLKGRRFDLSSLRVLGFGSEMIVPSVVSALTARFERLGAGALNVSFGYGMTETGLICASEPYPAEAAIGNLRDGDENPVVGRPRPGWSLRVVDETGRPVSGRDSGNIEVWSRDCLFSGYLGDEDGAGMFTDDGWFRTGDRGMLEAGGLRITGREKATIIINGRNVSLDRIEASLRGTRGTDPVLLAAAAVRPVGATTDELAVFFVPNATDVGLLDRITRHIKRSTMKAAGVAARHCVPLQAADFPLTATGKIGRARLVSGYLANRWPAHVLRPSARSAAEAAEPDIETVLARIWQDALKLDVPPAPDDNFHDLGGDSLASAELIFAVEDAFRCEISIDAFFRRPTLAAMANLVERRGTRPPAPAEPSPSGQRLLHRLQSYVSSWQGERLFADSLIVGANTRGRRVPIFWVLQEYGELAALAARMGPDQPLYAMRSCVNILPVREYSTDVLETVANRYLWEILALPVSGPVVLGGNCQGAIIALALARKLRQIGKTPRSLILMEWSYSFGRFEEPTLFLHGEKSHTAGIFSNPQTRGPDWRSDFPRHEVGIVHGGHGEFFQEKNIGSLAEALQRRTESPPPQWRHAPRSFLRALRARIKP